LNPTDEFDGTFLFQNGFGQYEVDRPNVLNAGTPGLVSATGFQDRVAKAAKNQGLRYQRGWVALDKEDGRHKSAFWLARDHGPHARTRTTSIMPT